MGNQQGKDPNLDRQGDTFGAGKKPHSGDNGTAPQDQPNNSSETGHVGGGGIAKTAAGKVTGAYNGAADKVGKGIQKSANYVNVSIGNKATKVLSHVLIWTVLGGAGYGIYQYSQQNPLYSGNVCSTLNDNGDQYSGDTSVNGSAGTLTDKGSKVYNLAKQLFIVCKKLGMNAIQASGVVGNAIVEGGGQGTLDLGESDGSGDNGKGLYQFTPGIPGGQTLEHYVAWVKTDDAKKYGGGGNADPFGKDSMVLQTAGLAAVKQGSGNAAAGLKQYMDKSASSPADAAKNFYGSFENNISTWTVDGVHADWRTDDATDAYKMFAAETASIGPDASIADGNSATAEQANDANCNDQGDNQQTASDMVGVAKQLLGYFSYVLGGMDVSNSGSYQNISSISQVKKSGNTDCSGFVWLVMKLSGYNVPTDRFATGLMEDDAKGQHQYFKAVDPSNAKAGDVFIINKGSGSGPDGHTGILLEDWHGNDTKIINEGGMGGNGPVNESTYYEACKDLVDGGGRLTLAQPVKK